MNDRKKCPVLQCPRTLAQKFAVCKFHWDTAPSHLRKNVVDSCREADQARASGTWPTPEYLAAVTELVKAVEKVIKDGRERFGARSVLRVPG